MRVERRERELWGSDGVGMDSCVVAHGKDFALGFDEGDDASAALASVCCPVEGLRCGFRDVDPAC